MAEPATSADEGPAVSYHALTAGTPVLAAGGEPVGAVRRVLDNPREGIFDGIVVEISGTERFVDAPEVRRCAQRAVTLTLDADEARRLSRYTPGPRVGRLRDLQVGDARAQRQSLIARAYRIRRTLTAVLTYSIYLVLGSRLPTAVYAAGALICLALLVLWLVHRRRTP